MNKIKRKRLQDPASYSPSRRRVPGVRAAPAAPRVRRCPGRPRALADLARPGSRRARPRPGGRPCRWAPWVREAQARPARPAGTLVSTRGRHRGSGRDAPWPWPRGEGGDQGFFLVEGQSFLVVLYMWLVWNARLNPHYFAIVRKLYYSEVLPLRPALSIRALLA